MNAMSDKPFVPDRGRRGAKPVAEAEGVHLTIDFDEDVAADASGTAVAGGWDDEEGGGATPAAEPNAEPHAAPAGERPAPGHGAESGRETAPAGSARRKGAAPAGMPAMLAGIEVMLSVEIGSHRLPLKELMAVDPGQLFPLDRMTSEPVSILVNGRPFARGEVVAIGDRFGVRLLDMVSQEAE
jgi:flagellar motor switch protein FliN/FliY